MSEGGYRIAQEFIDLALQIRKDYADAVSLVLSNQLSIEVAKSKLEGIKDDLDSLSMVDRDNRNSEFINAAQQLQDSLIELSREMAPATVAISDVEGRAVKLHAALRERYPDMSDADLHAEISERLGPV